MDGSIPPEFRLPPYVVVFGPKANCTLEICPVQYSVYGYRPSLAANITFICVFAIALGGHTYLGIRWRSWFFMAAMILGCLSAIIGYIARVIMYNNPFNFAAFLIQIIFVPSTPIYYCASIYVTIAYAIQYFSPELSRFNPKFFYWIFIPCDFVSLAIQASGGALSTVSSGQSQMGVNLGLFGLAFQVFTIVVFCGFFGDYLWRYFRSGKAESFSLRMKLFFGFLMAAIVIILARCAFRLAELHAGYRGGMIRDEGLFIGLEGVLITITVFCLMIGHPGLVFKARGSSKELEAASAPENGEVISEKLNGSRTEEPCAGHDAPSET